MYPHKATLSRLLTVLFLVGSFLTTTAQIDYKYIESQRLGEKRQVKVQVPRGYSKDESKTYPLIVVLDGDYLFEPVAGMVDYFSYWEDMPDAIVVGVNMASSRRDDTQYDLDNYLPADRGIDFYEFLGIELMEMLNDQYRIADFRMIVGHDISANFMNYFLFKPTPLYQAYINLSPDYAPQMVDRMPERLRNMEQQTYYYLATAEGDAEKLRKEIQIMDEYLMGVENGKLEYYFQNFGDATHYSLAAMAIPDALSKIFAVFRPISVADFKEKLTTENADPIKFLKEKYETINALFDLNIPVRVNDFRSVEAALIKAEKWDDLEDLGKWARKVYPDTMLGPYMMAYALEMSGEPKKAMKMYQAAFILEEVSTLTKDTMLERSDAIKADFGW